MQFSIPAKEEQRLQALQEYNILDVSDYGIGIDKEYHKQIFQLFKRLHSKEEYARMGIGLASCKKIIENLGGKIWLESEENKGSTFYFTVKKAIT